MPESPIIIFAAGLALGALGALCALALVSKGPPDEFH